MTSLSEWLGARGAHHDLVRWAEPFGADARAAWEACPRGDWLLGLAVRAGLGPWSVARAALAVARFGLEDVPEDALPVAGALARAEALVARAGAGDDEDVSRELTRLEEDAAAFERAGDAAADPALAATLLAVACALRVPARSDDAPSVPALVAQAAVHSAGDCAMMAALGYAQRRAAELVRAHVPGADVARAIASVATAGKGP